jgi:HK97 family phage major capsid protein
VVGTKPEGMGESTMNQRRIEQLAKKARAIAKSADLEGRDLTQQERVELHGLLDEVESLKESGAQVAAFGKAIGGVDSSVPQVGGYHSASGGPGDMFVNSPGFKAISDPAHRGQQWTSGAVEVGAMALQTKAGTLFESGQGSGLFPVPQVVPGVVSRLFEQPAVTDLIPQNQATTSSLRYIVEGTATSGAAGVLEGGDKPASDFSYSTTDEPVRKLATSLVVSDELLEDGGASVQAYLNGRLSLFVRLEEERQVLRGTASPELVGLFGRSINSYSRGTVDSNATAILKAALGTRGSAHLDVDACVMHPLNWQSTRLATDTTGQYMGGGPFFGQYGNGQNIGVPSAATASAGASLWNIPVYLSSTVGVGTALLGSFSQGAAIYRRGGPTVEVTNAHQDFFTKNLMAIRAESRLALCCYRPSAFVQVIGLS